jgi:hypothetical protein
VFSRVATRDRLKAAAIDAAIMGTIILGTAFSPSRYKRGLTFSMLGALVGTVPAELFSLFDLTGNGSRAKGSSRCASPAPTAGKRPTASSSTAG